MLELQNAIPVFHIIFRSINAPERKFAYIDQNSLDICSTKDKESPPTTLLHHLPHSCLSCSQQPERSSLQFAKALPFVTTTTTISVFNKPSQINLFVLFYSSGLLLLLLASYWLSENTAILSQTKINIGYKAHRNNFEIVQRLNKALENRSWTPSNKQLFRETGITMPTLLSNIWSPRRSFSIRSVQWGTLLSKTDFTHLCLKWFCFSPAASVGADKLTTTSIDLQRVLTVYNLKSANKQKREHCTAFPEHSFHFF